MIYDCRLRCMHSLPRGPKLLDLKSAFFNLKSIRPLGPDSLLSLDVATGGDQPTLISENHNPSSQIVTYDFNMLRCLTALQTESILP